MPNRSMPNRMAVAVMSFDRPHYLERVLQTVRSQLPLRHLALDFFLFQDGATGLRSGQTFGDAKRLAQSQEVFRAYLPEGQIMASAWNLGVALNFDRAERTLYAELGYEVVLFLEDDLVLHPGYFQVIERLLEMTVDRSDIGMVSALGFAYATPQTEQRARLRDIVLMDEHNWAFAMWRRAWEARDRVLAPYLDLMRQIDYRDRDKGEMKTALHSLQKALGRHGQGYLTSQDSMKNMALELLGIHRISSFANFARYIGREGLHSNAAKFESQGHGRTVVCEAMPEGFDMPDAATLRRMRLGLQYR